MAVITGTNGPDVLTGTEGDDEIITLDGFDVVDALGGADIIRIGAGEKRILGGAGNDTFIFSVRPTASGSNFNGGDGVDTLDFSGLSTAFAFANGVTYSGFERFIGSAFGDAFGLAGATVSLAFFGGGGNDTLNGGSAADLIEGQDGDDLLVFSAGADTLRGGSGNDVFLGVNAGTSGVIEGGDGFDTGVSNVGRPPFEGPAPVVVVDLAAGTVTSNGMLIPVSFTGIEGWSFTGIASSAASNTGGIAYGDANANRFTANEEFAVGAYFDGRGGNDTLLGSEANDTLIGGDGDDVLLPSRAGSGPLDEVQGGSGSDTVSFENRALFVSIDLAAGAATSGADQINARLSSIENARGSAQADQLFGDAGGNLLEGIGGNDQLSGRAGDDTLDGGTGDDILDGGAGNDTAVFAGSRANYTLTQQSDGSYLITGVGSGVDRLISIERLRFSDQTIVLGEGRGGITLTAGNDQNFGTFANDTVSGGDGNDLLLGAGGDDTLYGDAGADTINGETGNDILRGGTGDDLMSGEGGDDFLFGDIGFDVLIGGAGNDSLNGQESDDALFAGAGNDVLSGEDGNDQLYGDVGDDLQIGGAGNDIINGEGGADFLVGGTGDDVISGETGSDILRGEDGNDVLLGGFGADFDQLEGGAGVDVLFGEGGTDALFGGDGDDVAYGGGGADDAFTGGAGRDRLVFRPDELDGPGLLARFIDFQTGQDVIDVSQLDADTTRAGDQAFRLVDVFTFSAGQAVLVTSNGVTTFLADTNGDGQPDYGFQILNTVPVAGDFIL